MQMTRQSKHLYGSQSGCQGYDPIFIAATLGLDTLAIDISPTAIKAANE